MSVRMIVELPGGNKLLLGGQGLLTGLSDVGVADHIPKVPSERFKAALGSIADLVAMFEESVGRMVHRPDSIKMEFGASLSSECDLWVVSGEGKAEFKVTLAWGKRE